MFRVLKPGGRCFIAEPRHVFWASIPLMAMWLLASIMVARQHHPLWERLPRAKKSDRAQDRSLQRLVPAIAMESGPNLARWALSVRTLREKLSANNSAKCSRDIVLSIPLRTP